MYRRPEKGRPNLPDQSTWFEVPGGTRVLAVKPGIVRVAQMVSRGNYVLVDHLDGTASQYMHLQEMSAKVDDRVDGGQSIGTVGWDLASGYKLRHLHFQYRRDYKTLKASGYKVDPAPYLRQWKVVP